MDENRRRVHKTNILFDLGSTLVHYYDHSEIPEVLGQCIESVRIFLEEKGLLRIAPAVMWQRVKRENCEAKDYRVRPLEERLIRIFDIDEKESTNEFIMDICRLFMNPIFMRGHCYEDTLPALQQLESMGLITAIVSNTPWGSPAELWRKEVTRLGLSTYMSALVFCRDAGWRKPAPQIFEFALENLHVSPANCLFVGDDPRWDIAGPRAVGIDALLIDRKENHKHIDAVSIKNLNDLVSKLKT